MSKRLLALNVALTATAVLLVVQLVRVLSAPQPLPPPSAPPAPQAVAAARSEPVSPRPSLAVYGVVATKNLFNPNRSEAVAQAGALPVVKPVLQGVVINSTTRLAYLEDPLTKRVFGYKTGDTVAGGRLEQIEADRVVIMRPDGPLEVRLKDPSKPKPAVGARIPPAGVPRVPSIAPTPPGDPTPVPPFGPRPLLRRPSPRGAESQEEPAQGR